MQFYSTYYKKLANYDQIKQIGEKFNVLDANQDTGLNKDELANIFAGQTMTEDEKNLFMTGLDADNDGFITYSEFTPAFLEFDINQDGEFSADEYDFAKKRIDELEKQTQINEQYQILNSITSTEQEKETAQNNINKFNVQRKIIYAEQNITKKEILIGDKDLKIQQIQDFINNNTLLEFEEAQKTQEIEELNVQKNILLKEKDIVVNRKDLEALNLALINAQQNGNNNEVSVLEQQIISRENELKVSEKELELHHKQAKIEDKENLLTRFFVPEIVKENARKELDLLYDETQLMNQRKFLYSKISTLSQTRSQLLEVGYQYEQTQDPALLAQLEQLNEDQIAQQTEAQIASLQVELLDKKIQLKAVLPKSDRKPFDQVKADLEAEIAELEQQIATLQS